jgi:uncharacterized membrane protein
MKLTQKRVHLFFKIGVVAKGIDGLLEAVSGFSLFFVTTGSLRHWVDWLTEGELQEDPDDFVATHLVTFFNHLSIHTKYFAAIFLLIHGIVKLGLVTGLLLGKLWAYPTAMSVLGLFFGYQIYRIIHTHSIGLAFLSVIDLLILILIWRDYQYLKARNARAGENL